MSVIEGIGDELTITVSLFVTFITLTIAWFSTRVSDNRVTQPASGLHIELSRVPVLQPNGDVREGVSPVEITETEPGVSELPRTDLVIPQGPERVEENSSSKRQLKSEESSSRVSGTRISSDNDISSPIEVEADNSQNSGAVEEISSVSVGNDEGAAPECNVRNRKTGEALSVDEGSTRSRISAPECEQDRNECPSETKEPISSTVKSDEESGEVGHHQNNGQISLKIKFLNESERVVLTSTEETVGNFKRHNFLEECRGGKVVHLIFNGQFLRDDSRRLASYNLSDNCVLHCHISQQRQSPGGAAQQRSPGEQGELDLGQFMVPLFACTIGFVWYLRWQYSYMFNTMSTMSLSAVTALFMLAVLAAWRG